MELYIIRHAQSSNNALRDRNDRVCDPHLTELGRRQAARLAHHLANEPHPEQRYGIVRLYCSAMHRSLETATTIGDAIGIQPEVWIDLHENGGIPRRARRRGQRVRDGRSV